MTAVLIRQAEALREKTDALRKLLNKLDMAFAESSRVLEESSQLAFEIKNIINDGEEEQQ